LIPFRTIRLASGAVAGLALFLTSVPAGAQKPAQAAVTPPPSPVRYTVARELTVRRAVQLPGSVESRVVSVVAGEVEGLVVEYPIREGDRVERGQPLARLRTEPLQLRRDAVNAQLQEAEARQKQAERTLARARELFDSRVISQQQLDDAQYEFNAWQGRVDSLLAQINALNLDLERSTVRAPFAGVVVRERTQVGQWLAEGGAVAELMSLDELEVRVDVPERYFASIKTGAPATVTFEVLPGVSVAGRVSAVIPRADPEARTFPLRVCIPNREGRIGVGMLVQVAFPGGEAVRATVVPKDAVVNQAGRQYVFLLGEDNTVSMVAVETGQGAGVWIEVRGGLRPGQRIITRGNERLRPGQFVQGEPLNYQVP
jgi:RND family efflux transporter MFP subunit